METEEPRAEYLIWNVMDQTADCLHCGGRFDMKYWATDMPVEYYCAVQEAFSKNHREECGSRQEPRGKALEEYNTWYHAASMVTFGAAEKQLWAFCEKNYHASEKEFQTFWSREAPTTGDFGYRGLGRLEIYHPKDGTFFIYRQFWKTEKREDLWDALQAEGCDMQCERSYEAMPEHLVEYGFHKPKYRRRNRDPERYWSH